MAIPYPVLEVETIPHGSLIASTMFGYGARLREDYTREVLLDFIPFATTRFGTIPYRDSRLDTSLTLFEEPFLHD
jgi:hypothetical protein